MYNAHNKSILNITLLALSLGALPSANAQLVNNLLIGNAKAVALGNAVTADPPGIDSIHFNPAGLTRLKGRQMQVKVIAAELGIYGEFTSNEEYDQRLEANGEVDPIANTKSEIAGVAVYMPGKGITEVPVTLGAAGGMSYSPPGSKFTFATAAYAPFAGGFIRDEDDPGRYSLTEGALTRITYFSPTIAYKITDTLSVGASLGISYFGAGIASDLRAPNPILEGVKNLTDAACEGEDNGLVFHGVPIDLCGGQISPYENLLSVATGGETYFSPTYNLGILWEATPWLTLGAVYLSESKDNLDLDVFIEFSENLIGFTEGLANSNPVLESVINALELTEEFRQIETPGSAELILPAHFSAGASIQITPSLKFNVDWKWYETSKWDEIAIKIDESIPLIELLALIEVPGVESRALIFDRGYEDASNFAFGLEYQYSDRLALRLGYEPRNSGIPDDKLDFLVPLGDFDLYGAGLSLQLDTHSAVDFAIAYGKSEQYIPTGSSTNGNNYSIDNFIYNPYAGLDVRTSFNFIAFEMSYQTYF